MNVVFSEVEIVNSALIKLGAEPIISLDDSSNRARIMKARYNAVRDKVLRNHLWNFAKYYVQLAVIDPLPAGIFDYDYAFQIPGDCLRVLETSLAPLAPWEEINGKIIVCRSSELTIKGIRRVTDVTQYDSSFVDALACALAADTSYAFTQSSAQKEALQNDLKLALREARTNDSQIGKINQVEASEWLNSRRY